LHHIRRIFSAIGLLKMTRAIQLNTTICSTFVVLVHRLRLFYCFNHSTMFYFYEFVLVFCSLKRRLWHYLDNIISTVSLINQRASVVCLDPSVFSTVYLPLSHCETLGAKLCKLLVWRVFFKVMQILVWRVYVKVM